jgi:hypothetical protein
MLAAQIMAERPWAGERPLISWSFEIAPHFDEWAKPSF